jgi:hypothetical protein
VFKRLIFTLATAGCLISLAALYSLAMKPVVVIPPRQQPQVQRTEYTEAKRPAENVRVAATYVPSQKWATESKYMLRAEQAFVYTQAWRREESSDKRVQFEPFAMVWVSTDKNGVEQAVSVISESAQLEFASAFDEKNQNPGRVVGAVLNGKVYISGPDGLMVAGHDFIFNEASLSLDTTNPVRFKYQSNFGTAEQMRIKLIPAEGLPGLDRPHIYGVESIRLIGGEKTVHLIFHLPQGKEVRPVSVRCGELEYAVATNTAVLNTDIRVWTGPENQYDWLYCDTLTMQFVPKKADPAENKEVAEQPPSEDPSRENDYQKLETNLEFSWLEAVANVDQIKVVKVHSHTYGVDARMTRLAYDAESQVLSMSSEDPRKDVSIVRNGSELKAPEIEAHLRTADANPLEKLFCFGKGELIYVDEKSGRVAFVANWEKQLSKTLDAETNLDLIQLDQKAQFRQPDRVSGLGADLVKIWLVPFTFGTPDPGTEKQKETRTPELEPKRMLAVGDVAFLSPQLLIKQTDELDIRFDEEPAAPATTDVRNPRTSLEPSGLTMVNRVEAYRQPFQAAAPLQPATGRRTRQVGFASIPALPEKALSRSSPAQADEAPQLITILAKRIGVRLQRLAGQRDPTVKEVHADGRVLITQERKHGEQPMRIEGDRVDVKADRDKREVVHVHGSPALIRDRGFEIEGKNIHLDRGSNRAWVNGTGELKLLIPSETKIPGVEANSQKKLRVRWNESMDFNGLAATFLGHVEAKLGHGTMHCEQMIVELAKRISFQSDSPETKPALHTVHCLDNVRFENSTYVDKKVIDIYRGRVGEFKLDYVTGDVVAQGPGEIHAWQRQQKSEGVAARDAIQANRPISVEVTVLDYTGIQFEGRLKGHFDGQSNGHPTRQRATIDDRVQVVHGPVRWPNEFIDPDHLPSGSGTIRCDQLQFVNYPISERSPVEYREFVGTGNAEIEGQADDRNFTASADEISYDGSKNVYVLRAHGRQTARLTVVGSAPVPNGTGARRSVKAQEAGRRITFNPETRALHVEHATDAQGAQ